MQIREVHLWKNGPPTTRGAAELVGGRRALTAGLTLFEVLIATAVLGIVFLGLMAALGDSFLATQAAYASTRSQNLAKRVMEEISAVPFDDLLSLDGNVIEEEGFRVTVHVVEASPGLCLVEVVANRPGAHMAETRLLTYRAER